MTYAHDIILAQKTIFIVCQFLKLELFVIFNKKESMQNQEIVKIIENLKGRRNYEEKRASKLGFASLYDYFEDKISKKQKAIEDEQKELEASKADNQTKATKKKLQLLLIKKVLDFVDSQDFHRLLVYHRHQMECT